MERGVGLGLFQQPRPREQTAHPPLRYLAKPAVAGFGRRERPDPPCELLAVGLPCMRDADARGGRQRPGGQCAAERILLGAQVAHQADVHANLDGQLLGPVDVAA